MNADLFQPLALLAISLEMHITVEPAPEGSTRLTISGDGHVAKYQTNGSPEEVIGEFGTILNSVMDFDSDGLLADGAYRWRPRARGPEATDHAVQAIGQLACGLYAANEVHGFAGAAFPTGPTGWRTSWSDTGDSALLDVWSEAFGKINSSIFGGPHEMGEA